MPPKPHPKRSEIADLLREGLVHSEIASCLDVGESLVAKVARLEGLTRKQGRRPGGHRESIFMLIEENLAPGEIALTVGCSKRLVEMYLLEQRCR